MTAPLDPPLYHAIETISAALDDARRTIAELAAERDGLRARLAPICGGTDFWDAHTPREIGEEARRLRDATTDAIVSIVKARAEAAEAENAMLRAALTSIQAAKVTTTDSVATVLTVLGEVLTVAELAAESEQRRHLLAQIREGRFSERAQRHLQAEERAAAAEAENARLRAGLHEGLRYVAGGLVYGAHDDAHAHIVSVMRAALAESSPPTPQEPRR